jgi:hypothetical protein
MCRSFEFSKMKKILQKNSFFGHLQNFEKSVFVRKNLWELLDARDHIFDSYKICNIAAPSKYRAS